MVIALPWCSVVLGGGDCVTGVGIVVDWQKLRCWHCDLSLLELVIVLPGGDLRWPGLVIVLLESGLVWTGGDSAAGAVNGVVCCRLCCCSVDMRRLGLAIEPLTWGSVCTGTDCVAASAIGAGWSW